MGLLDDFDEWFDELPPFLRIRRGRRYQPGRFYTSDWRQTIPGILAFTEQDIRELLSEEGFLEELLAQIEENIQRRSAERDDGQTL